jgi:hypothetical protein
MQRLEMSPKKWLMLGSVLAIVTALAGLAIGLPIVRTPRYRAMIDEYARATPVQPESGPKQP